uniref:MBL fold metallo-hydrolase n=2 Tax=Delftia TaxID=80865 RepID=UPI0035A10BAD
MTTSAPTSDSAALPPGMTVLERGWLSANNIVFAADPADPQDDGAAVVDTGYVSHADQTVLLIEQTLAGQPLARILNTHLHSDHCGGNAALQARWPQ